MKGSEGVPAWLDEPPDRRPIFVHTRPQNLPFEALTADNFERLVLRLVKRSDDVKHAQQYGVRGQAQHAIDLYARTRAHGRRYRTVQCRNVAKLTRKDLISAVEDFLAGEWAPRCAMFVFATRVPTIRTELAEGIEEAAALLHAHDMAFEVWDGEALSETLQEIPELVECFFGSEAKRVFCSEASLRRLEGDGGPVCNLPATSEIVIGREEQLAALQLASSDGGGPLLVTGEAGSGKTTITLCFGHRNKGRFPDGRIYLNLGGFGLRDRLNVTQAAGHLLTALSRQWDGTVEEHRTPVQSVRSLFAERRCLIILDNVATSDQVRELLPGEGNSFILITSRRHLGVTSHEVGRSVEMSRLSRDESYALLTVVLGPDRLRAEAAATDRIITFCVGLPLALRIFAAQAARRTAVSLTEMVEELDDPYTRTLVFEHGEAEGSLWSVIDTSYRALDPEAARVFRLIGAVPEGDLGIDHMTALLGGQHPERVLRNLVDLHLLEETGRRRFRMHNILRAFAVQHLNGDEGAVAFRGLLDALLVNAVAADLRISPDRPMKRRWLALPAQVPTRSFTTVEEAGSWFSDNQDLLVACIFRATNEGAEEHAWKLVWAMTPCLWRQGELHTALALQRLGVQAAEATGDTRAQATIWRLLASTDQYLANHESGFAHAREAVRVSEEHEDLGELAHSTYILAAGLATAGRHDHAVPEYEKAVEQFRVSGEPRWVAFGLNGLGASLLELGDLTAAEEAVRSALDEQRNFLDRNNEAASLRTLAQVYSRTGNLPEAEETFARAAQIYRELLYLPRQALTHQELAEEYRRHGHNASAHRHAKVASSLYTKAEQPEKAKEVLRLYPSEGSSGR